MLSKKTDANSAIAISLHSRHRHLIQIWASSGQSFGRYGQKIVFAWGLFWELQDRYSLRYNSKSICKCDKHAPVYVLIICYIIISCRYLYFLLSSFFLSYLQINHLSIPIVLESMEEKHFNFFSSDIKQNYQIVFLKRSSKITHYKSVHSVYLFMIKAVSYTL